MDKLENEEMQVVSYVKLKNISFHPTEIQGRLYLKDTMGELQEKLHCLEGNKLCLLLMEL